jgi:hypothetical protein
MADLKLVIERLDKKLETIYDNPRHLKEASNCVFGSGVREGIDLEKFLDSIEDGTAFNFGAFSSASKGNFLDFISPEFCAMAQPLIDITAGGNGGMASIGRGEFAISFFSNFQTVITKSGSGDLEDTDGKKEEVKHNGGKLAIEDMSGNEISRTFKVLVESQNIQLKKKNYLPVRKGDSKLYSADEKKTLNGLYWQAMTGESCVPMSDSEWCIKSLNRAFTHLFNKVDSLLVMNHQNDFVRFFNSKTALQFYSQRLPAIEFELRADQANAPSFYLGKKELN